MENLKGKYLELCRKLKDADFKDKQDMDNLTFEREKLEFALKIISELENRKCINCKHSSVRFNIDCNLINKLDLPENFYCNKWESKQ